MQLVGLPFRRALKKNVIAVRRFLRRRAASHQIDKFRKEAWFETLVECQEEICSAAPDKFYRDVYRREEVYYWVYIPKWLYEDSEMQYAKILDIGCQYGTLAVYAKKLFGGEVYCSDTRDQLSQVLINRYSLFFSVSNIELDQLPWKDRFDAIIFTEVLEHLNFHPMFTLKKIHQLLRDEGRLYMSTPDAASWGKRTNYYSDLAEIPYPKKGLKIVDDHVYHYNLSELTSVLNEAGFKIDRFAYSPGIDANRHFNMVLSKN